MTTQINSSQKKKTIAVVFGPMSPPGLSSDSMMNCARGGRGGGCAAEGVEWWRRTQHACASCGAEWRWRRAENVVITMTTIMPSEITFAAVEYDGSSNV